MSWWFVCWRCVKIIGTPSIYINLKSLAYGFLGNVDQQPWTPTDRMSTRSQKRSSTQPVSDEFFMTNIPSLQCFKSHDQLPSHLLDSELATWLTYINPLTPHVYWMWNILAWYITTNTLQATAQTNPEKKIQHWKLPIKKSSTSPPFQPQFLLG